MNVQNQIKDIYEKLGSINTRLTENRQLAGGYHNLLSATHQDTESASPLRGAIITGQTATPEWRRLVLGTTGQYLRSDGTDIAWADLQSGDLPSHSHVKTDISDTPWAWTDVSKSGSLLNDIGNVNASPGDGDVLTWVDGSSEWQAAAGGGGAPSDGQYLVLAYETGLTEERLVTEGVGIKFTDAGAGSTFTIANEFHETIGTETGNLLTAGYVKADELWIEAAATAFYIRLMSGETLTGSKTLDLYVGDTNRVLSLLGGGIYVTDASVYLNQNLRIIDTPEFAQVKLTAVGGFSLALRDVETLTANRTLYFDMNDGNHSLDMAGDLFVESGNARINQDLTSDSTSAEFDSLRLGGTPATTGDLRLTNAGWIYSRNAAGSANIAIMAVDSTNRIVLGAANALYIDGSAKNLGIAQGTWGTGAVHVLAFYEGTAPSTSPTNCAQMWADDLYGGGSVGFQMKNENTETLNIAGVRVRTTTGDPAAGYPGMLCNNTFDDNVKIFADAAWRTLAVWPVVRTRAYVSADVIGITDSAWTAVPCNAENYDTGNNYNTSTFIFLTARAGWYLVIGNCQFIQTTATCKYYVAFEYNGTIICQDLRVAAADNDPIHCQISDIYYFASGMNVIMKYYTDDTSGTTDIDGGSPRTYFSIHLLSV